MKIAYMVSCCLGLENYPGSRTTYALGYGVAKISVIVPVGNLQRDLNNIELMCSGDFGGFFEFILVIDQMEPLKNEQIKPISLPNVKIVQCYNGSPGLTRNEGLKYASGEYVAFWDSDDLIDKNVLFECLNQLEIDADLLIFDYRVTNRISGKEELIHNNAEIGQCLRTPAIWRMLFKNDPTKLGFFGKYKCGEDQVFLLTCNLQDRNYAFIPVVFYTYLVHSEMQLSRDPASLIDLMHSLGEINNQLSKPEYANHINYYFRANLIGSIIKRISIFPARKRILILLRLFKLFDFPTISVFQSRIQRMMREWRPQQYFTLAGGLGNQLFQTAAGFEANPQAVHLVTNLLHVARGISGRPQIFELNLPIELVDENNFRFSSLIKKIVNLNLRIISNFTNGLLKYVFAKVLSLIATAIFLLVNQKFIYVHLNSNLGYSSKFRNIVPTLYVGYFQSSEVVDRFVEVMRYVPMVQASKDSVFSSYLELAKVKKPILVHIRLGDYKNEHKIGLLSERYFLKGIQHLQTLENPKQLWIFSNEPEIATPYLESLPKTLKMVVPTSELNTYETLELMRSMSGYVIGNSTFSWWAARLKYDEKALVVAPDPWFKLMDDPDGLIPREWTKIEAESK